MFCSFTLNDFNFNERDFKLYLDKGKCNFLDQSQHIKNVVDEYLNPNGSLNANIIEDDWFPQINADVFISHSHNDYNKVIALAGYLNNLGLSVFVDSCTWWLYDDLLKNIDDKYCVSSIKTNGSVIYDYDTRNKSTAYVQTILNSALMKMIDKTECLIFIETPNSIKTKDLKSITTESCWIYSELLMSNYLRRKEPKRAQKQNVSNRLNFIIDKKPLIVEYRVDISHMVPITLKDFEKASNNGENLGLDLLDQLYINKELVRGINLYGEENGKED